MMFALRRAKQLGFLAMLMILLTVCVSGPGLSAQDTSAKDRLGPDAPRWLIDKNSAFPDSEFLAEVGEGDTKREAEAEAASSISRIFISKISVESTAVMRYRELDTGKASSSVTEKSIDKTVNIESAQDLINLRFSDSYTDKMGRVYMLGYLNRKDTAKIYRDKISQNGERVTGFLKNMKEAEGVMLRYACIDAAVLFAKINELLLEQLTIIHGPSRKLIELPYSMDQLSKLYAETAAKMAFSVKIKNDSDGRIAKITAAVLNQRGFTVARGSAPLSVTGDILVEDTELNNKYKNVRWTLTLEMNDEKGDTIASLHKNERTSAVSRTQAVALAYKDMEKKIKDEFMGQFEEYLNSLILK